MADKIYFVDSDPKTGGGAVKIIDPDGSNEKTLVGKEAGQPDGLEVDLNGGKMYWTDMGPGGAMDKSVAINDGRIMRANLDGTDIETLVPHGITTTPKQLTLDVSGGKVYWCDRGDVGKENVNPKVMRANLDGSDVETLISADVMSPVGIALDVPNGKLYFSDRFANTIKRANLDGTDGEVLVENTSYPVDLAIDFEKRNLYWTARTEGVVYVVNMDKTNVDGAGLTPFATGLHTPIGISIDRKKGELYVSDPYVDSLSGALWKSNLDGSDAERIATTVLPLGIFFVNNEE